MKPSHRLFHLMINQGLTCTMVLKNSILGSMRNVGFKPLQLYDHDIVYGNILDEYPDKHLMLSTSTVRFDDIMIVECPMVETLLNTKLGQLIIETFAVADEKIHR